ncbi:outer membrane porin, OprD family [Pseudomonas sp. FW306-02-F02-AA]|uniref:Porin n=1 Tax=Pseudomonas fluorescens TaxID=294 RepID=A0A0N9WPI4_PSEFL|nr:MULTISPECIES: OprD family porin [Pseudomonas]ALI04333.1 porin [Pseudomonas fluorescens]PMZ01650.1 outer membrane porin, OprD family [Pseudomonas sp. FW306-02-F02-AB]PMZ10139.1 outer membrane porin, OprD family [Pseudomonas sp. FW306-02-H06C]PMZ13198.1 outer membrane porin, OprD family [Pseudomonas sp. FW306-02-F02-AA]PMZ19242.1 outer membrane porin, OprD family [Pseudomonas sp. FW306-02-F08-AA]
MRPPFPLITPCPVLGFGALLLCAGFTAQSQASGFIEDSSVKVESRTVYFNRDFRDGHTSNEQGASKRDESAQGFILNLQSGYTEGTVGFGVDALGMLGLKLDSSPDSSNSGLLPSTGENPRGSKDQYAKLGLTAKVRVSQSVLKYGAQLPDLPLLKYNDGRLLPTMLNGVMLTSKEFKDLTFTAARLDKYTARDSTDAQDIRVHCKNKRYACNVTADHFDMYGIDYKINERLTAQYHYAELEDIYRQHFVGLLANQPLGSGLLKADLRVFDSADSGAARAGSIENRALSGMLGYTLGGHTLSAGWQRMIGDNSMPYLDGSNPYLVNYVQVNDFAAAQERSWQLRYDYDFKAVGLNGLSFLTRYVNGDQIKVPGSEQEGKEWERDSELKYVVQSGTFKDLSLRLRNATYRSNYEKFARDVDETRLIVSYNFSVL